MGNSKHFKKKTTPKRSYPNQYEYEGATVDKNVSFYVVQIDRIIAKKTKKGDSVTIQKNGRELEVNISEGKLGNVPISKVELIESTGYSIGSIVEISDSLDRIKVTLNG